MRLTDFGVLFNPRLARDRNALRVLGVCPETLAAKVIIPGKTALILYRLIHGKKKAVTK